MSSAVTSANRHRSGPEPDSEKKTREHFESRIVQEREWGRKKEGRKKKSVAASVVHFESTTPPKRQLDRLSPAEPLARTGELHHQSNWERFHANRSYKIPSREPGRRKRSGEKE